MSFERIKLTRFDLKDFRNKDELKPQMFLF